MSNTPIAIDLPHSLGAAEARRRIENGVGNLKDHIPGAAEVRSAWNGDQLGLQIMAMGQEVNARLDVRESLVHLEMLLPPALAFFAKPIEAALRHGGTAMLEDKSRGRAR
ncbi:polyhydroxyalkanoic acid system family protein [Sphingosinicella sp.]|uniref:polyhydroxyalkanoic acid system family protein n=1 Tax=Sphingosinicella sp. TaxID=1917971 RepID=UPI004037A056